MPATHGAPPRDFLKGELTEWFGLHGRMEHASGAGRSALEGRHAELETRIRTWPRTVENGPFRASSLELGRLLSEATGLAVLVGFNEFCSPSVEEALEQAVAQSAARVVVVTAMMTRGGEHADRDIPAAIGHMRARYPGIRFVYAWPFEDEDVASFLASRVSREP